MTHDNPLYDQPGGFEIATLQRGRVATWLRLKAAGMNDADLKVYRDICGGDEQMQRMFHQLRMDALHSGLLWRLFTGEEPYADAR